MQKQRLFRLIGSKIVFSLERELKSAGAIPAVVGYTLDRKRMTIAAESDVIWLPQAA